MTEPRMVSEQELESLISKRLKERQEIINEAVKALRPELAAMREEIAAANHIKQTLGRDINRLSREVRATNRQLTQHAALPGHPGTEAAVAQIKEEMEKGEDLMEEFGISDMSTEQRRAFPVVLKTFITAGEQAKKQDRMSERRQVWIHLAASFMSALVTAIVVISAFLAWISQHPLVVTRP